MASPTICLAEQSLCCCSAQYSTAHYGYFYPHVLTRCIGSLTNSACPQQNTTHSFVQRLISDKKKDASGEENKHRWW